MGQLRFDVPAELRGELRHWESAYVSGLDGLPWDCQVSWQGDLLAVTRAVDESGKLSINWPVMGRGTWNLATCALREKATPYHLPLELARGGCYRAREQAAAWQRSGLRLSEDVEAELENATDVFVDAALARGSRQASATSLSQKAIGLIEAATDHLMDAYTEQALQFRRQQESPLGTLLGALLPSTGPGAVAEAYRAACNTAVVPIGWTHVETDAGQYVFDALDEQISWAAASGLRICAGPLLEFDVKRLPHWLYLLEDNFNGLLEAVEQFIERAVERYRGRVHLWQAAAGLNTDGPLRLNDEQIMQLAVVAIQTIRRLDPKTPVLISVDQPWGEYLARPGSGLSPLHFADALVRSNLGLAGLGLDFHLGYWPQGTMPRNLLDISQQVDRWSLLGLPLLIRVGVPADSGPDERAEGISAAMTFGPENENSSPFQSAYGARILQLLMAKPAVHGVFWAGWNDGAPHVLPHAGLLDTSGQARPLLGEIANLRRKLLF
jgi:hypothetical protein